MAGYAGLAPPRLLVARRVALGKTVRGHPHVLGRKPLAAFGSARGGITRPEARAVLSAAPTPADAARLTRARLAGLLRQLDAACQSAGDLQQACTGRELGTGLTWDFDTAIISARVCRAGLPATGDRGVVACVAVAIIFVEGHGDTRAAARGRGAAPGDSQATLVLE
jgi:hypothetical protein